jgi:hypothetical protein
MGFHDDLAKLVQDARIRRLAELRAGNHELAEDALQETYLALARVKSPETIRDLRAFFCRSLIREIQHQRTRPTPIPIEDAGATAGRSSGPGPSSDTSTAPSVESEVWLRLLGREMLNRLDHDHDHLIASVPGRSPDHLRYRATIVATATRLLRLLLEGHVSPADWNLVLKSEYPEWCNQAGLAHNAIDQRLSRARRDVQLLLQTIARKEDLAAVDMHHEQ